MEDSEAKMHVHVDIGVERVKKTSLTPQPISI